MPTPLTLPHYPDPPACAQCGKRFEATRPRLRSAWGDLCADCHAGGATLLRATPQPAGRGKPACTVGPLHGPQGNVFAVIAEVRRCLRANGQRVHATAFVDGTKTCKRDDEVFDLARRYVELTILEDV